MVKKDPPRARITCMHKLLSAVYILYCDAAENPNVKDIFRLLYLPSGGKERSKQIATVIM